MGNLIEEWRPVVGFEGLYEVSNTQKVRSIGRCTVGKNGSVRNFKGKILSNSLSNGYICYNLRDGKRGYKCYLHRIIAEAFISNPENKPCIDHINTIRTDNRIENLRWVTHKENSSNEKTKHHLKESAYDNELCKKKIRETRDKKGLNKKVYTYDKTGKFQKEYTRASELAEIIGVPSSHVNNACLYGYAIKGILCRYKKLDCVKNHNFSKKKIAQYTKNGEFIRFWDSIKEASDYYSVKTICRVCNGGRKTAAGFIWKYADY